MGVPVNERVRKYREKRKAMTGPGAPKRLDTYVSSAVLQALDDFASTTGQQKEILVERAIVEYISNYVVQFPNLEENSRGEYFVHVRPGNNEVKAIQVCLNDKHRASVPPVSLVRVIEDHDELIR